MLFRFQAHRCFQVALNFRVRRPFLHTDRGVPTSPRRDLDPHVGKLGEKLLLLPVSAIELRERRAIRTR